MASLYNRIAGRSTDRLAALSDGVFAFAMTVLVLDLHVPAAFTIASEADLRHALVELAPRLLTYLMSFLTLGIFWVGQNTQHDLLKKQRPRLFLDPHRLPDGRHAGAVFDLAAGGVHHLSYRPVRLLVQHRVSRRDAVSPAGTMRALMDLCGPVRRRHRIARWCAAS